MVKIRNLRGQIPRTSDDMMSLKRAEKMKV